jgi:hypothetical protein
VLNISPHSWTVLDAGHIEQMTIILTYVDTETGCMNGYFDESILVQYTIDATLMNTILREQQSLHTDINDCYGHVYGSEATWLA